MPNSHPDDSPVSWGRFEVTIRGIEERLGALADQARSHAILLERNGEALAKAEENRRGLSSDFEALSKHVEERKQRTWTLVTIMLTGLLLPLLLAVLTIVFHLRNG